MRRWLLLPALLIAPLLAAAPVEAEGPALTIEVVRSGLTIPWDLAFLPDGSMLYTERTAKRLTLRRANGTEQVVLNSPAGMWAAGETGLMSVELAADFSTTRDFFTCHGYQAGSTQDVRVVRWHLNPEMTAATIKRTLVSGLPSTSGRHGGCALVKGIRNNLFIGTGDAATGTVPQARTSGGGKVLRVDATTGLGISTNPYASSSILMKRRLYTYGHRNVQGLARRSNGTIWSVEHGSYRDDEVNQLTFGGNYGWNPVRRTSSDPAYNEGANSPMTDYQIPGAQVAARWRSGDPTVATSGATFLDSPRWGPWQGALAVAALKDASLRIMRFAADGTLQSTELPPELRSSQYGRLRAAVLGPDGALFLTTSNGSNDQILRVTPAG
ncbi:PQQ-dependent sugar dehydrogenase [Aeromicrobium sp.]|uniref:PQQ-dependent sugar dehydrogenase n=1 Tax=Aeromicrobium sp. TaxID=1871063 RepID=UPI0030C0A645